MSRPVPRALILLVTMWVSVSFGASKDAADVAQSIDTRHATYAKMARQIWEFAEVGYQEEKSSKLLQSHLQSEGFQVEAGVAEMPTAFVATYGSGKPVVAILAEFDALPGCPKTRWPSVNLCKNWRLDMDAGTIYSARPRPPLPSR